MVVPQGKGESIRKALLCNLIWKLTSLRKVSKTKIDRRGDGCLIPLASSFYTHPAFLCQFIMEALRISKTNSNSPWSLSQVRGDLPPAVDARAPLQVAARLRRPRRPLALRRLLLAPLDHPYKGEKGSKEVE